MNYDFLVIEGSDCSGKTSLIKSLSESLGFKVLKGSSFEHSQCNNLELFNKFKDMTKEKMVVFDRFIYSNEVYAQLYDDFAILTNEQRREIEQDIQSRAFLIYLEADIDVLTSRMNDRGDDYVTVDRLVGIKEMYEESLHNCEIDFVRIDTSNLNKDEVLNAVLKVLN